MKNILNYKKPGFWISLIGIIIIVVIGLGLLSNPRNDVNMVGVDKSIENAAREFIDEHIAMRNDPETTRNGLRIIDSKITKLEKLAIFDDILDYPIELWNLEFKLKANENTKAAVESGTIIEDGWITEDNDMGKTCLIFKIDDDNISLLNARQAADFNFTSLAKLEASVRVKIAYMDLLPNGAYEGNHMIVKFSLPTDGNIEMFLSQPVIQGDKGIWAVERWKDQDGIVHHAFPGIDISRTDVSINERYEELQDQFDNGEDLSLGDPIEVAISFIHSTIRQIYLEKFHVEITDLQVINPATMEDF